ncbi:hypothetical protein NBRC116594_23270 [Shimia sp. NS0008-38b]|uniref:hypothetical protein n=1 Tax=Shimia sp. NS0008-38b TaxID=3127653 RepID=UPI003108CB64
MSRITSFAQIKKMRDAGEISNVEWLLIENCKAGRPTTLNGDRPEKPSPKVSVQAELLRYLILGGCDVCRVDELGVQLKGAYIKEKLDLSMCETRGVILLSECVLDEVFEAVQATMVQLNLRGSLLRSGANLTGATVSGGIYLTSSVNRPAFECHNGLKLIGANINGQFAASGGQFLNETGVALHGQSCVVNGPVFLTESFLAKGEVNFEGAKVGNLWIKNAHISSAQVQMDRSGWGLNAQSLEVSGNILIGSETQVIGGIRLSGADISGKLEIVDCRLEGLSRPNEQTDRAAFEAGRVKAQSIHWKVDSAKGNVSFSGAICDTLNDKLDSWELKTWTRAATYNLDGFVYEHLARVGQMKKRMEWADKSVARDGEFSPQPLSHLAKVLRDMGHEAQARVALVAKERRGAQERRRLLKPDSEAFNGGEGGLPFHWLVRTVLWCWDKVVDITVGYGYFPQRSVVILALLLSVATFVFHRAYESGYFAPNSGVILMSHDWRSVAELPRCVDEKSDEEAEVCVTNPAEVWSRKGAAGQDYETFNRFAYAADIVIPIINLGQEGAWAPSTTRGVEGQTDWGFIAWWARWVLSLCGWLVTALGAAAITGIIRRD